MPCRNPHLAKLHSNYLFPEVARRKERFLSTHPEASLISLGIGDTTEPIPPSIAYAMQEKARALSTPSGYSGYGPEQGSLELRQSIARNIYENKISPQEIFISDGSKCDIGRLQLLFGAATSLAVQDPSYPAYVDTGVALGMSSFYEPDHLQYKGIHYMPCSPENEFFPHLSPTSVPDVFYFCSPNNPTGAVASRQQLETLVAWATRHHVMIVFDAAYAAYIQDPLLPRSIYEIPGARHVAIELGSFSKMAGFTGVRLGWSVVPEELCYSDGFSVQRDWHRIHSTFFNGASNIAQAGGIGALQAEGREAIRLLSDSYLANTRLLKQALEECGYKVYGGFHAPYLWLKVDSLSSWEAFEFFLEHFHLITTPGSGFGPSGEGYLRMSAFSHRSQIEKACERLLQVDHPHHHTTN